MTPAPVVRAWSTPDDHTGIVVPIPDLDELVGPWRDRFDAVVTNVPAHITLLVPWLPPDAITDADLVAVEHIAANHAPFEVAFARFETFTPTDAPVVHWLDPIPAAPFRRLTADIVAKWRQHQPYEGRYGREPIPHLTVSSTGSESEIGPMRAAVGAGLPLRTTASELSVLVVRSGACEVRAQFPLGG